MNTSHETDVTPLAEEPISLFERLTLLYAGVLAPVFAHLFIAPLLSFGPRYQTGFLRDKLGFTLMFDSLAWVYPMVIFCMISFASLVVEIRGLGNASWARLGTLTGIPIGLAYHVAVVMLIEMNPVNLLIYHLIPIAAVVVVWGITKLIVRFTPNQKAAWVAGAILVFGSPTILAIVLVLVNQDTSFIAFIALPFAVVLYASVAYSPLMMLASYSWILSRVHEIYPLQLRFSMGALMGWVTWLGAFFAATRYSVLNSLETYSRLPLTDPGTCFIATAACQGHPRLVKTRTTAMGGIVSRQLQCFKAFELILKACLPNIHRVLRVVYNRFGPVVAQRIRSPWAADACYLMLKPAEWFARIVLCSLLGRKTNLVDRLYE